MARLKPGERWCYKSERVLRDRLATLEDWARRHVLQMDADEGRRAALERVRAEYGAVEAAILDHLAAEPSRALVIEQFRPLASAWGVTKQTISDVAERMWRAGVLSYEWAGPSHAGTWWHWYYLRKDIKDTYANTQEVATDGYEDGQEGGEDGYEPGNYGTYDGYGTNGGSADRSAARRDW